MGFAPCGLHLGTTISIRSLLRRTSGESHQPLWGVQWFRSTLSPFPTSPIPFGERFTSPLPLSVVSLPPGPEVGEPPLAARSPSRSDPQILYFFDRFLKQVWFHFGSQYGPQNLPKSIKNHSKNNFGLKNVNFSKIAPRLHQKLIFEGSGSQKPLENHEKTLPKLMKNRTKKLTDF